MAQKDTGLHMRQRSRAFIVADSNKRRTLSRADIAKALSKSDQFDFLIDIVPRDDPFPHNNAAKKNAAAAAGSTGAAPHVAAGAPGNSSTKRDQVSVANPMNRRPPILTITCRKTNLVLIAWKSGFLKVLLLVRRQTLVHCRADQH